MSEESQSIPVVLVFSGHDPSGGAGVHADIEAIISQGCHCASVITALTIQDTRNVMGFVEVDPALIVQQARAILADMPVKAIKIGMIGSVAVAEVIHSILLDYPDIPVVLDPVLVASGGGALAEEDLADAIKNLLFPLTTVLTPNAMESRRLAPGMDTVEARGLALLEMGPQYVLVKGADEDTEMVHNLLFGGHRLLHQFNWPRLPHQYHGSGCTLAAAIAGLLAQGSDPFMAVHQAQDYTYAALENGVQLGHGQYVPHRLFWADTEESDTLAQLDPDNASIH
ncbi:MAG TPA: hydroxymethylpyrimidine/phosphomethylpyrimidine kinase [Halothiobacillus sp.]|nr:hydroxymethylpyrimidine/phosphomethylpyrimidine kinase [Halothiobacillus sp.]